jgi:DNA-3-methyladenine glycosylase II
MGLSSAQIKASLAAIAGLEPHMERALGRVGYPEPRIRDRGYETLLRTIIGQQVSVKAAQSIWNKLEANLGDLKDPRTVLTAEEGALRANGLSQQKQGYAISLAQLVVDGEVDLFNLPKDDEEAIALMTKVKDGLISGQQGILLCRLDWEKS